MLLVMLIVKKLFEGFTRKNYKKLIKRNIRVEEVIKRKGVNYMLND